MVAQLNSMNTSRSRASLSSVYPSESSIARNLEQRKALGGGKSYGYRYKSMQREEWYVDFEAKAFWSSDNC
jgi:hypothetical protein